MALRVDLAPGDVVLVGEARLVMVHKTGRRARLEVAAPVGLRVEHVKAAPDPKPDAEQMEIVVETAEERMRRIRGAGM